jgi:hypothetical protein
VPTSRTRGRHERPDARALGSVRRSAQSTRSHSLPMSRTPYGDAPFGKLPTAQSSVRRVTPLQHSWSRVVRCPRILAPVRSSGRELPFFLRRQTPTCLLAEPRGTIPRHTDLRFRRFFAVVTPRGDDPVAYNGRVPRMRRTPPRSPRCGRYNKAAPSLHADPVGTREGNRVCRSHHERAPGDEKSAFATRWRAYCPSATRRCAAPIRVANLVARAASRTRLASPELLSTIRPEADGREQNAEDESSMFHSGNLERSEARAAHSQNSDRTALASVRTCIGTRARRLGNFIGRPPRTTHPRGVRPTRPARALRS